jgi:chaperonin GroEL
MLFGDAARAALLRGVEQMTALLAPTLGPVPRTVAVAPIVGSDPPEVLDDAATIARRMLELPDSFENAGAMLIRSTVLEIGGRAGDGGATTAVLTRALLQEACRQVAAGANVTRLVQGIRLGLEHIRCALERASWQIDGPDEIAGIARQSLGDTELAETIGEIVDAVGADGIVLVQDGRTTETTHEYVDGVRWDGGYLSSYLLASGESTGRVVEPRILLTDQPITRPDQLVPALEACVAAGEPRLVIITPELSDAALGLLLANRERGMVEGALAILAPSIGYQRTGILQDLAAITGGRCIRGELGDRLEQVTLADLGTARQVWATRQAFGVIGGRGDKAVIRQRVEEVRAELAAGQDDPYVRAKVRERLAKLIGTGATIQVGAPTRRAQELLKERVEAALATSRLALEQGVVTGGGIALLACAESLSQLDLSGDVALGARVLGRALAAPAETIAANAGLDGRAIVWQARQQEPGQAFDVVRQCWADARDSGVVDPIGVTLGALDAAVSAATTMLGVEVLLRRRDPIRRIRASR